MPRWTLAAAFAAGLLPGLMLYWSATRPPSTPSQTGIPAPVQPATPPAAPQAPAAHEDDADEARRAERARPAAPAQRDADTRLIAESQEWQAKFNAAERVLADTQSRLRELEARAAAQDQQLQTTQSSEGSLREQLQAAQRQAAAAEANLKARDTRVTTLEAAHERAQRQGLDAQQRLQRVGELSAELEDIARRRDSYLNSIFARYRETTDLFRALSLRLDNPRDGGSPLTNDLSRIQSAIQAADEDLRQLRALGAQSAKVQKDLANRR